MDKLLTEDQCDGISDWKDLGRYERLKQFLNKDGCGYLNAINNKRKKEFEARKAVITSCGTQIADRKRYDHVV